MLLFAPDVDVDLVGGTEGNGLSVLDACLLLKIFENFLGNQRLLSLVSAAVGDVDDGVAVKA